VSLDKLKVLIRGGGEFASGVAYRLSQCHFRVLMTEMPQPQAVRREVVFCEAVYEEEKEVESMVAKLISSPDEIYKTWQESKLPLLVDPETKIKDILKPDVLVDAIMAKRNLGTRITDAPLVIGLGIGFEAGKDVHVVVKTRQGHNLGRVIREGQAEPGSGVPIEIDGFSEERVLRAPREGLLATGKQIGDVVGAGEVVASVDGVPVKASISGVIWGLLRDGTEVYQGMRVGDIDPRGVRDYCYGISDRARAIAGGVLEAIMSHFNDGAHIL